MKGVCLLYFCKLGRSVN